MQGRKVVVTGCGIVSPLGCDAQEVWQALCEGRSGIAAISEFDVSALNPRFGGEVQGFDLEKWMSAKEARRMDRYIQYGMAAGMQAVQSAGVAFDGEKAERIGAVIGSGIGGIGSIERGSLTLQERGQRRISPFLVPGSIINMVAGNLSVHYGFSGPTLAVATACTTGTHAIGLAARMIALGEADVMLAGGAEKSITPLGIAGFAAARSLSTRNDDPAAASRPWDRERDGFVLGDGAGIMVLEDYASAKRRGADILAEVAGFGMSSDAHHMTAPPEDGGGAARAMQAALKDAGCQPGEVQYINAHGTSTQLGDLAESRAIERVFGDHARRLAISSTKSMTGHLLGAAGAAEAIFSVLALQHQVAPPTINLDTPDKDCRLDYVPGAARDMKIKAVLSNSFGFGGTNGCLLLQKLAA